MATRKPPPPTLQESIFHHLCLPAFLPGCEESNLKSIDNALASSLAAACMYLYLGFHLRFSVDLDLLTRPTLLFLQHFNRLLSLSPGL